MNRWLEKVSPYIPLALFVFLFIYQVSADLIFYDGDTARQLYQYLNFLSRGGVSITQQILSGFPICVSVVGECFNPVFNLAARFMDTFSAYRFLTFLNIVLAYIFAFLYARKIGLNQIISAITASIFVFSGQMIIWLTVLVNTNYYFILPAILYFAEFARQNKQKYFFLVLTGLCLGLGWLSGHSQFVIYLHLFLAGYYIYWAFFEKRLKNYFLTAINLVVVYGVSLITGWLQIREVLNFRASSDMASGVGLENVWTSAYGLLDVIHYVLPFWKNPVVYNGSPNLYIGILPFILIVFSFFIFRKIKNRHFALFFGTFLFCLLLSIKYSPLGIAFHSLPFLNSLKVMPRVMFIGNFAIAVVVGFVLKYTTEHREEFRVKLESCLNVIKKIFLYIFIPIIGVGSIVKVFFGGKILIFINNYFLNNLYQKTAGMPKEHYLSLISQYLKDSLDSVFIFNWHVAVFVIFAILSFYLLKQIFKFQSTFFLFLVLVLIVANFTFAYARRFTTASRTEFLSLSKTADFISNSNQQGQFRIFTPFTGLTLYNELKIKCQNDSDLDELLLQKELLTPNLNMQFGIDSIDGYDNFMPQKMSEAIAYLGSEHTLEGSSLAKERVSMEDRVKKFVARKNILKSMNVRYVISSYEINDADFKKVFSEKVGKCEIPVSIYELSGYWPRNFVTSNFSVVGEGNNFQEIMDKLASNQNGPMVILEKPISFASSTEDIDFDNAIIFQNYGIDSINFDVDLKKEGLLFVGNSWLPGWTAFIDGQVVEILKANYVYMALPLSEGRHEVVLKYK